MAEQNRREQNTPEQSRATEQRRADIPGPLLKLSCMSGLRYRMGASNVASERYEPWSGCIGLATTMLTLIYSHQTLKKPGSYDMDDCMQCFVFLCLLNPGLSTGTGGDGCVQPLPATASEEQAQASIKSVVGWAGSRVSTAWLGIQGFRCSRSLLRFKVSAEFMTGCVGA